MTQKPNPSNKIWQAGFDDGAKGARAKSRLPTYLAGHKAGSDTSRDAKGVGDERLNPTPPAPKISAQTDPTSPSSTTVTPKSPRNATPESNAPQTSRKHAKPQKPKRFAAHFIAPRGRGQPTKYNDSLASTILRLMTTGMSLKRICDQPGMPCADSVYYWQAIHPDFSVRYARAMLDRAQFWAEEILDISDDGSNDWVEQQRNGRTVMVADHEHIQRSRLRVDTRKFLMAKLDPKRWGDKIQVSGDADNPLQVSVRDLAKEQHALSPPELAALHAFAEARRNATEIELSDSSSTDASETD
jgi:hypothetical protein